MSALQAKTSQVEAHYEEKGPSPASHPLPSQPAHHAPPQPGRPRCSQSLQGALAKAGRLEIALAAHAGFGSPAHATKHVWPGPGTGILVSNTTMPTRCYGMVPGTQACLPRSPRCRSPQQWWGPARPPCHRRWLRRAGGAGGRCRRRGHSWSAGCEGHRQQLEHAEAQGARTCGQKEEVTHPGWEFPAK